MSSEPKPHERVANNGAMSISIGEEGNKTERVRELGKRQEQLKQGASTDNCVNKGTQANVEGNKDTRVKTSASFRCNKLRVSISSSPHPPCHIK